MAKKVQVNPLEAAAVPLIDAGGAVSIDGLIGGETSSVAPVQPEAATESSPSLSEEKETVIVAASSPVRLPRAFKVLKDTAFYMRGASIRLFTGQIKKEDSFPPGTIDGWIANGVQLEEVPYE